MFPNQSPPHSDEPDTNKKPKTTTSGGSTGRPRGRPPGAKNKQNPSVSVAKKSNPRPRPPMTVDNCMSQYVLEVSGGSDIIAAVMQFCNSRRISLCVLSGSGSVCNVCLQLPTTTTALTVQGCFNLLSISATVIPSSSPVSAMLPPSTSDCLAKFIVSLAGPRGHVFGGVVVAAVDHSPGSGGEDNGQHHAAAQSPPQPPHPIVIESLSMYGLHQFPAGFRWPPTQQQTPPRYFTSLLMNGSS
ncbi:AT-hook motif nuclear-localized protein 28-like [Bidens hawaiensis]|uniref:AT-hook motif nuclear-localized protein 28-like n=1 Tax=Bidens hawaiensis TaxID=980011 RepID=UPI00404A7D94